MSSNRQGRFITLEGGEGAGKTTQIHLLRDYLAGRGITVVTTREPGGTPGAEAIRALLVDGAVDRWDAVSETLLHYAARRDHVERLIKPALARGDWVLCDRFADSSLVYQAMVQHVGIDRVLALHQWALSGFWPDLTLVLDLPVAQAMKRAAARDGSGASRYERMGNAFHEAVGQGFRQLAALYPERCALIDAARPAGAVAQDIAAVVAMRLDLAS